MKTKFAKLTLAASMLASLITVSPSAKADSDLPAGASRLHIEINQFPESAAEDYLRHLGGAEITFHPNETVTATVKYLDSRVIETYGPISQNQFIQRTALNKAPKFLRALGNTLMNQRSPLNLGALSVFFVGATTYLAHAMGASPGEMAATAAGIGGMCFSWVNFALANQDKQCFVDIEESSISIIDAINSGKRNDVYLRITAGTEAGIRNIFTTIFE